MQRFKIYPVNKEIKEEFEIIATVNDDPRVQHEFFMYGHAEIN